MYYYAPNFVLGQNESTKYAVDSINEYYHIIFRTLRRHFSSCALNKIPREIKTEAGMNYDLMRC